jgi:hypothetical protein
MVGGDSIGYHNLAVEIAERININGWGEWILRPNTDVATLATPAGLASAIYVLTYPNPFFLLPFNAFIHALSAVILFAMFESWFKDKKTSLMAILPFVIYPTSIFWTSQLLKEGVFILGSYIYLLSWLALAGVKNYSIRSLLPLLLISVGLWLIWSVRAYLMIVMLWMSVALGCLLTLWIIFQNDKQKTRFYKLTQAILFTVLTATSIQYARLMDPSIKITDWRGDEVLQPLRGAKIECPSWSNSKYIPESINRLMFKMLVVRSGYYDMVYIDSTSTIDREKCITNPQEVFEHLPRVMQVGLLAPFPSDWFFIKGKKSAYRIISGIEMCFSYLALCGFLLFLYKYYRKIEFWIMSSFSIGMILIYSLVTPNVGALHRMRFGFYVILVGMGVAFTYEIFRSVKSRNEN